MVETVELAVLVAVVPVAVQVALAATVELAAQVVAWGMRQVERLEPMVALAVQVVQSAATVVLRLHTEGLTEADKSVQHQVQVVEAVIHQ